MAEEKIRLGGMALPNGVLVHGPRAWACAIRHPDGRLEVAAEHRTDERIDSPLALPRQQPAVDRDLADGGDDVPLARCRDDRRREGRAEQRLDERRGDRVDLACATHRVDGRRRLAQHRVEKRLDLLLQLGSGRYADSRSISRAALTSALSAIDGSDAWPLRPWTRRTNGEVIFSAVAHR